MKESIKSFVIGFSGRIASGKSSVSRDIAERLHCPWVSFGGYIRQVASSLGLDPNNRKILQDIGNLLIDYPREFSGKVLEQGSYEAGHQLVIDGIRHKRIVDELRVQVAPAELVLVHIEADDPTIERRLLNDGETILDIQRLERDATEADVRYVLPDLADVIIKNSGSKTQETIVAEILQWIGNYSEQKRSSGGEETVVIPRREYERMRYELELAQIALQKAEANNGIRLLERQALLTRLNGGREYSLMEHTALETENTERLVDTHRQLLSDTLTAPDAAQLLGTTRHAPYSRVRRGTLLAVRDHGILRFPRWQFDPQGPNGVVSGLPEVLLVLRVSPIAKVNWLTKPSSTLDGRSPLGALRAGELDRVKDAAAAVGVV